jgi:hypothetical protein
MRKNRKSRWEGLIGWGILLLAIGFFGGVCFVVLRTFTRLPTWSEILLSVVVGVLGLVGMFFLPSLFGDEALFVGHTPDFKKSGKVKLDEGADDATKKPTSS